MILEPYFYLIAVVSVFLHGMGKGGFIGAGSFGSLLAIPMLSIFIPPFQAVAILLLPLIFMDLVTVWRYRRMWDMEILKFIVPLAFLGIMIGTFSFSYLSEDSIRVIIGLMAVIFCLDYYLRKNSTQPSFSIHAGGLPLSFYLLPMRLERRIYVATAGLFYLLINLFKIFPYAYLGQMNFQNIYTSLMLLPLAPLGVYAGAYLVDKINQDWFYRIGYFCTLIAGLKLVYDGVQNFM
jgi:uncharacterized membrane protein YfcA